MADRPPPARQLRPRSGGVGRSSSPYAERVSDDLRRGASPALRDRRRTAVLMLVASGCMAAVSLYQLGLVRHLPDPPLPGFDSDRVDASGEAYRLGAAADAPLGLVSYAATLALAAMGPDERAREKPWIPLVQAAKVLVDAGAAVVLTAEQVSKHRALCSYCLLAAAATVAAVPATLPEARQAWRTLRG